MRTTLDRVAVLLLVSACCFGCRSGGGSGNMFAWGKKKTDAGGEAPKFESTALPTAGQNPMNSLNQVTGNPSGQNGPTGGYAAQPAGYQPPNYPQTPYGQANLASANATAGAPATNPAAPAVGYSNPAAPPTNYAAPAMAATQAQAGPYNPNYNAAAVASAAPATNYGAPSGYGAPPPAYVGEASAPTDMRMGSNPATPVGGPDYRMADSRNTMPGGAPAFGGAPSMPSTPPAAAPPTNYTPAANTSPSSPNKAVVGDRYANIPMGSAEPASTAGRYNSPPSDYRPGNTGYQPGSTGYQPGASANPMGDTGYHPPATTSYGESGATTSPLRSDPGYSPGGTGRYTPQNTLRPATDNPAPESSERYPSSRVVPAHYEATDATAERVTPASGHATDQEKNASDDRYPPAEQYGPYQGAASGSPPELFPNHAF